MYLVNELGDKEQRERILTPAIKFEKILSFGLTEPNNGSDASGMACHVTKVDGGYLLNGTKRWIGGSTFAD